MPEHRRLLQVLSLIVVVSMLFSALAAPGASAQGDDGLKRQVNPQTGKVSFLAPESGRVLPAGKALGIASSSRPDDPGMALAKRFGPEFGLKNPARELRELKSHQSENGRMAVRYEQSYQGIPVLGGELIVNTNQNGDLYSINGEVSPDLLLPTQPSIDAKQARQTALQGAAKWYGRTPEDFIASEPELWIFDESLLRPSTRPAELVWRMEVIPDDVAMPVRELVLVDAERGSISLHFNQIDAAWTGAEKEKTNAVLSVTEPNLQSSSAGSTASTPDQAAGTGVTWYVATTGSDSNSCATPDVPCLTVNGAMSKSASGDTIKVASGTYSSAGPSPITVLISKSISLSGGWNTDFSAQDGFSVIEGPNTYGVYVNGSGITAAMDRFVISDFGAGVTVYYSGTLTLRDSSVVRNNTGIQNQGTLSLSNVTVSQNQTHGVANHHTLSILNSTIVNNETGGIYSGSWIYASTTIQNSILAKNGSPSDPGECTINAGSIVSSGFNLIGSTTGCPITLHATDKIGLDPRLSPLLDAGFHALFATSPAINAASPAACPAKDQRGVVRPSGAGCDIGSIEYPGTGSVPAYIFVYEGSPQHTVISSPGARELKAAVLDAEGRAVPGIMVSFTAPATGASAIFTATHANSITAATDSTGLATASGFSANNLPGSYSIEASAAGLVDSVMFQMTNGAAVKTYTANNSSVLPGTLLCSHTDSDCTNGDNPHADKAHFYALGTYDFYLNRHGRDSFDDNNLPIISTVHYSNDYYNAFWNGEQMVYGDAYAYPLADDIVAHEFTHGVTQYESNLFYYYQSGAINESLSDLWGEYYDQTNGLGNDAANVEWVIGEDALWLRLMSNPTYFLHPDKMSSTHYYTGPDDSGGVHTNSGVNNKAVFLMVDGGSFNGKTVSSLGWEKTAAIYYEANTNLLTSGSDYSDLYYALQQACSNLIGQKEISSADCAEVKDAVDAVEMNVEPAFTFNTHAPYCDQGEPVTTIFFDDLEAGTGNWTFHNGAYPRWQLDSSYGPYAHSGEHSLFADDYPARITDASAQLIPVVVPARAYLHFAHAYDFETSDAYYDGGMLEYSTNGGSSWADAGPLIDYNGYEGTVFTGAGNPLSGRSAFVGSSNGYISTRLNLASLMGKTVIFRWRMGLDEAASAWGWWVDDVRIYQCPSRPVGPGVYDDTHEAWNYSGLWNAYTGSGPYNNTLHQNNTTGSYAQVSFNGVQVRLTYLKAPSRGSINVYLDGTKVDTINASSAEIVWQNTWLSPVVSGGTHSIRFENAGGGWIDLDALEVFSADTTAPAAITTLSAVPGTGNGNVRLSWTAVGDDGTTGTAAAYLVRYSTSAILTETDWSNASIVSTGIPTPKAAGQAESMTVSLTAGQTYYFAVRARDEQSNLGALSNSPSATASAVLPTFGGVYDDTESAWTYTGDWATYNGSGPYSNTLHQNNTLGNSAQVTFFGTQVSLTFLKAPGRGVIDVYIDETKVNSLNANSSQIAWRATWMSETLSAGTHTVRFENGGGGWVDLDAIQIHGPVAAGIYDDSHSAWSYSEGWQAYSGIGPYSNTLHQNNGAGSFAEISFYGTRVSLTFLKAPERGSIDVYIDETKVDTINASSTGVVWQSTWKSQPLMAAVHKVKFVNSSGGWIDLDALEIYAPPTPVGAGTYDDAHPAWTYSGTWQTYNGSGPYSNTLHQNNAEGNYAEVAFDGAQVKLTYLKAPGRGLIDVYIDESRVDTIAANNTGLAWQSTWTSQTLSAGSHTVRFENAGGGWIDLDALQVYEADTAAPAAITTLSATTGSGNGMVTLSWTAVGDDGATDAAAAYLVRYSTSAILTQTDWDNATIVSSGIPAPQVAGQTESMAVGGLTAGQTYYFAVRADDEQSNLGELSNSPSAVASTAPAVGAGVYDDLESAWNYVGSWSTYNGTGPYSNSLHQNNTTGSYAEVTFTGIKISLSYLKAPGRGLLDVYIDGSNVATIDASSSGLVWQANWTSQTLNVGTHTVQFMNAGGGWIDLDAIRVYAPISAGTYDDADSAWSYSGTWEVYQGTGPYNNTLHQNNTTDDYAELSFAGTGITLRYLEAPGRASIDVYLDGIKVDTINASSSGLVWQSTWTSHALDPGTHTVRFRNAGGGWIDLDALIIQ